MTLVFAINLTQHNTVKTNPSKPNNPTNPNDPNNPSISNEAYNPSEHIIPYNSHTTELITVVNP